MLDPNFLKDRNLSSDIKIAELLLLLQPHNSNLISLESGSILL